MTTAAPSQVHIEIPGFANHALYEGAAAWDACGPVANEVAVAALERRTPDVGNARAIRARDLAAGHFTPRSGQTLADIHWDLSTQRGYTNLEWIDYSDAPNLAALHDLVKRGALAGHPVILVVRSAYNLPDNERGVSVHFVVVGGIDSARGYLIANGDTRTAIAGQARYGQWPACSTVPTNWATWAQIEAAGIAGAIVVHPKTVTPPVPADPAPASPSEAQQAASLLAQALTLISQAEDKLKAL